MKLSRVGLAPLEMCKYIGGKLVAIKRYSLFLSNVFFKVLRIRPKRILSLTGFTLIELITVMGIILVLLGFGIPAYTSWQNRAKIAKARATIEKIGMALEMYKTDFGFYPQEVSGACDLNASGKVHDYLMDQFQVASVNYGPYMKHPSEEMSGDVLLDPWQNAFVVYTAPIQAGASNFNHNTSNYYIYSTGPNSTFDNDTGDDIDSYQPI